MNSIEVITSVQRRCCRTPEENVNFRRPSRIFERRGTSIVSLFGSVRDGVIFHRASQSINNTYMKDDAWYLSQNFCPLWTVDGLGNWRTSPAMPCV